MADNILCERKEQAALTGLYEKMNELLKDSDDSVQKEKIKKAIQSMTETTSYMILGEEGVGKTSLLRALFQDIVEVSEYTDADVCEYRWGEAEYTGGIKDGCQKRFLPVENLKGLSIIDTRGLKGLPQASWQKVRELVQTCEAVLVALDVRNVKASRVWDILESVPSKKLLFFVTKCDLASAQEIEQSVERVKNYMADSNVSAPVFPVSVIEEGQKAANIVSVEKVRAFIRDELVGANPILSKHKQNVEETRQLLIELRQSFALRKKQYESDVEILYKINKALDDYVLNHKEVIEKFTKKLCEEIGKDIDSYEQEIISKMDPYKIKERFHSQKDFEDYLNMVNDNYKSMMNDSVNRKTIETIKSCMGDLEIIFQEAVGYFNKRENILALNDRFYGTLSTSRNEMIVQTKETAVAAETFYKTLSEASETLFMQIWEERKKYDKAIKTRERVAKGGGVITGGGGAVALMALKGAGIFTAKTGLAGVAAAAGGVGLIFIGAILVAASVNAFAKWKFDPLAASKMEENTRQCIEQFKGEVANTRKAITEQVTAQITALFEDELKTVDSCFTEFRMTVNIDERRLPELEEKMAQTESLLEQLQAM